MTTRWSAPGLLDQRLGKRRLRLDTQDAHPLVQALHALRAEGPDLLSLSVGATQLTRRLKRAEAKERRRERLADGVAAAAMLSARRRGEDAKGLIRAFERGAPPGAPPATPITRLLQDALEADDDPHTLAAFLRSLAARTKLFKRPEHVRGVINLWRHREGWLKKVETWAAPPRSATRQFTAWPNTLRAPSSRVHERAWFEGDPKHLAWCRHIGATGSLPGRPATLRVTRRSALLHGRARDYGVGAACAGAGARGRRPRTATCAARARAQFGHEEFWKSVLRFSENRCSPGPLRAHRRLPAPPLRTPRCSRGRRASCRPSPRSDMTGRRRPCATWRVWHGRLAREGSSGPALEAERHPLRRGLGRPRAAT